MKKRLKFVFLFILSIVFIFTCGFTDSDWNDYKSDYGIDDKTETKKCIYKSNENTNLGFDKYTLILSSIGIYDQFNNAAANPLIAEKNSNTESSFLFGNKKI